MAAKVNVLVTGAAGFMGAHLTRELLKETGLEVFALDDLSGGFIENVPDGAHFIRGSCTDHTFVDSLFQQHRFAYVYHLGAYAAEGLSHFIRRFNYTNNLIGSINLINNAVLHGTKCFVFTSSIAVYGAGQVPMTENMLPQPEDPYGIAKYAVELDLRAAHEMFGLDHVIFRPHNVYGEFQNVGDRYRNVVGIFMSQILKGEPMTVFGDGEQQRAFSYVGDIIGPISRSPWISGAKNMTFNVGADTPSTVNFLAAEVGKAMGASGHPITHLAARSEVKTAFSDHSLVRSVFGDQPSTSLEEGLLKMAEWVKRNGPRKTSRFEAIEIPKNLPASWLA